MTHCVILYDHRLEFNDFMLSKKYVYIELESQFVATQYPFEQFINIIHRSSYLYIIIILFMLAQFPLIYLKRKDNVSNNSTPFHQKDDISWTDSMLCRTQGKIEGLEYFYL